MQKAIEVVDLVKKYKKEPKAAVDRISFDTKAGEFFVLLGPNGAGKTTTLSILNTTLAKTSGTVKVAGYDVEAKPAAVRKRIGVIFQNPSIDLNLTAEENVRFHANLYGLFPYRFSYSLMPLDYKKKIEELAGILGIEKDIHKPIKTFSGGMKRKLEIVRGLIHRPKILFLDEPTTGLDPQSRQNLWQYLKKVRQEDGLTLFLTTHYLEEAEKADRICIINQGRVVALGTPKEIKRELVDEYLILEAENEEQLKKELTEMKLNFEKEDGQFLVKAKNSQIQGIICGLKSRLSHINLHSPTLEEAYLEIISQNSNENN